MEYPFCFNSQNIFIYFYVSAILCTNKKGRKEIKRFLCMKAKLLYTMDCFDCPIRHDRIVLSILNSVIISGIIRKSYQPFYH